MNLAAAAKIAIIGALALVLFVPVGMIQGLIAERQMRRNEVVAGIADGWGKRQTVAGGRLRTTNRTRRASTPSFLAGIGAIGE